MTRIAVLAVAVASISDLEAQTLDDSRLAVETWASGIERPTCLAFVGDGELLVTEAHTGRVRIVRDGAIVGTALDLDVTSAGLLGLVVDPDFAANRYVYMFVCPSATGDGGDWAGSGVWRYTFDGAALGSPFGPLFSVPFDVTQSNAGDHDSGYLCFGPDGKLYGQVGDKKRGSFTDPRIEQNTGPVGSASAGGIFRIETDGSIPTDNPFVNESDPALRPWFVYGFRNSLGMDFDPLTGSLWFSENGSSSYDELNRAVPGMNSGWLKLMGPDARNATYVENGDTAFDATDLVVLPGSTYRDPEFSWSDCIGVTSVAFLASKRFPVDLWNDLLVGESNNGGLYRFELDPSRQSVVVDGALADHVADDATERDLLRIGSNFGVLTDVQVGPDGYVYLASYFGGRILRIRPLADRFEPIGLSVLEGVVDSGGLLSLEVSDDQALILGPAGGVELFAERAYEARFVLNAQEPAQLDVLIESAGSRTPAWQSVELWDVVLGVWRAQDVSRLATADQLLRLADVPSPADYVDPLTLEVRVRVRQISPSIAPAVTLGAGGASGGVFRARTDLLRLEVTWR